MGYNIKQNADGSTSLINEASSAEVLKLDRDGNVDFTAATSVDIAVPKGRAVTATVAGATTGLLTTADFGRFLTVTASDAAHIVMLPAAGAAFVGGVIEMWVGANGFELRANGTAATINGLDCKTTNEAAVPATHRVRATLVAAETWLLEGDTELGARVTIVPDVV